MYSSYDSPTQSNSDSDQASLSYYHDYGYDYDDGIMSTRGSDGNYTTSGQGTGTDHSPGRTSSTGGRSP